MEGYEFLTAHFINDERTTVEVYWVEVNEDGEPGETIVEYVEAAIDGEGRALEGQAQWKALLEHIDIDTLHDNTAKHMVAQQEEFRRMVMDIAKNDGLVYDLDTLNSNMYKAVAAALFAPFDPEADKENLFMFKLQLFEIDDIKSSKNRSAKAKLRKAQTILEAVKYAIEIVEATE